MAEPTLAELTEQFQSVMQDGQPQIQAGDSYPIDDYILLLRTLGYTADYKNIHSEFGFIAQVRINGTRHALWQGGITHSGHSVLEVQRPLTEFDAEDSGPGGNP